MTLSWDAVARWRAVAFASLACALGCHSFDAATADPGSEAGTAVGGSCNGVLACERIVFVTSQTFTGDLGGLSGADAKCVAAATASGKPNVTEAARSFKAWIGTPGSNAKDRLVHGTAPYKSPDGRVVATSFDRVLSGRLDATPSDENGVAIGGTAWTATTPSGTTGIDGARCSEWRSGDSRTFGFAGNVGSTTSAWTSALSISCDVLSRLYCFEN